MLSIMPMAGLSGCNNQEKAATQTAVQSDPVPKLTGDARQKIVTASTKGFEAERDKMEKITFYTPQITLDAWNTQTLSAYISLPDDGEPILRMNPHYHGDSWIFFQEVKVMADDQIVYDKMLPYEKMKHDNNSAGVFESADYVANDDDISALRKIAAAKSVTVRLSGNQNRQDFDMSAADQKRIADALKAYDTLRASL